MKITSVEIHPAQSSNVCVLSFRDPKRENPYNVKSIAGLDADEIVARYYGSSDNSEDKYYSMVLQQRDIVARIQLNPDFIEDESYSDLRDNIFKLVSSSRTGVIQIQFKNGTEVIAVVSGLFRKVEASLFTETPEVQLTLECLNPMLQGPSRTVVDVSAFDPGLSTVIDDLSTAPHGFMFEMEFTGAVDTFLLTDPDQSGWSFSISPVGGFEIGDILHFSSETNNRHLYIERGASVIHVADALAPSSVWPMIFPGANAFSITNSDFMTWRSLSYYTTYWGV